MAIILEQHQKETHQFLQRFLEWLEERGEGIGKDGQEGRSN